MKLIRKMINSFAWFLNFPDGIDGKSKKDK